MKKETVEEFLNRGGKIKKVEVHTHYYRKYFDYNGKFVDYTNKSKIEKTKQIIKKLEGN